MLRYEAKSHLFSASIDICVDRNTLPLRVSEAQALLCTRSNVLRRQHTSCALAVNENYDPGTLVYFWRALKLTADI